MLSEGNIKVLSETRLTDMSFVPEVESHEVDTVVILVAAIEQGRLGVGTTIEVMEPLQTSRQVTPTDVNHVLQSGTVIAGEETEEELVTGCDGPVNLRVDIVEIERIVLEVLVELEEGIEIRSTGGDEE